MEKIYSFFTLNEEELRSHSGLRKAPLTAGQFDLELKRYHGDAESVRVPDGIMYIGDEAFRDCINLRKIILPDSVQQISDHAFSGCENLVCAELPQTLCVSDGCFPKKCQIVLRGEAVLPESDADMQTEEAAESIADISDTAKPAAEEQPAEAADVPSEDPDFEIKDGVLIRYHGNAEQVQIPERVKAIGYRAFAFCDKIKQISIPACVQSIAESAFMNCTCLMYINIPEGIKAIRASTFVNCSSLGVIRMPDSVTEIGDNAFEWCSKVTILTIPGSVTRIGAYAFYGCAGLKEILIPDSVTSIGEAAFGKCDGIKKITVPDSVQKLDTGAFRDCKRLRTASVPHGLSLPPAGFPLLCLVTRR